ncbi:MAG: ATP-binding protein [Spirochaetia bacterium]|nr:ATP-binding protein [Spirochaetia bacterium]
MNFASQYVYFVYTAPILAVLICFFLLAVWVFRSAQLTGYLAWLMISCIGWLLLNSLEVLAQTEEYTRLFAKITYIFIASTFMSWFFFALNYTKKINLITKYKIAAIYIVPVLGLILVFTNEYHNLFWEKISFIRVENYLGFFAEEYGPFFWFFTIYAYSLIFLGIFIIIRQVYNSFKIYKWQSFWVLTGAALPLLYNIVYTFHLAFYMKKDYTPIVLGFSCIFFSISMLRYRLLDINPIARDILVDTMKNAMLVLDEKNRICDINNAAIELIGIPADKIIGQLPENVFKVWSEELKKKFLNKQIETEVFLSQNEKSGYYDLHICPIYGKKNKEIGRLIILNDVTNKLRTEIIRDDTERIVRHDMKNLLNGMLGFAELLSAESLTKTQKEYVDTIQENGNKMVHMINHTFDLFRMSEGTYVPQKEEIDLCVLIKSIGKNLNSLIEEKKINIRCDHNEKSCFVKAEAIHIENLMTNLVKNAAEASPKSKEITIVVKEDEDNAIIDIHNWGVIPAKVRDKFFERYSSSGKKGGMGLGSYSAKLIARSHGGDISFTSSEDSGTNLIVSLPRN